MRPDAFTAPGRFHRGNLHTHSNLSDGAHSPEEVCRRYRDEGYDFLCLSEHFVGLFGYPVADTAPFRTNSFTTIPGAELHTGALANGELWHILAVGLPPDFAPTDTPVFAVHDGQESGAEAAARARAAGAFVVIAHPQWYGMTLADARAIEAAHAVEIYNHGCAQECDRGDGFAILDLLLSEGRRLGACATDDAHFFGPDHFGGWVMVKAEANDPDLLLAALKEGRYYSSQGPELHDIEVEGSRIHVACSAAETVIAVGAGATSEQVHGPSMTRATLRVDRARDRGGWTRVIVMDAARRRAWSNPIWLD